MRAGRAGSAADLLAPLRPYLQNSLPPLRTTWWAGVLGTRPSRYSQSPRLWNAAFGTLGLAAVYVPLDVAVADVGPFLDVCRTLPHLLGLNVTVPHKARVLSHLDALDPEAEAIGAVNTIVRAKAGTFLGGNTDASAAAQALRALLLGSADTARLRLVVLGAGGAARAVGVGVGRDFAGAEIMVCARRPAQAEEAARAIGRVIPSVRAGGPESLDDVLPEATVLVNASTVGMAGPLATDQGVTWLEPYSALAPAESPLLTGAETSLRPERAVSPPARWWEAAWPSIVGNLERSLRRALRLRPGAAGLDLVYAPAETVFLRHMRWTGHATANGLGILVGQAVAAFARVCAAIVPDAPGTRETVARAMTAALDGRGGSRGRRSS